MRTLTGLVLCAVLLPGAPGCGEETTPAGPLANHVDRDRLDVTLQDYEGEVLVLLMGMEGCGGTRDATRTLAEIAGQLGDDVKVLRVDAPPPGGSIDPAESSPIPYGFDGERHIAGHLDFFYYPTLYLLDRQGEVRFAGGCDAARVKEMVTVLRDEKPGDTKKMFTPPMPAKGEKAPAVRGVGLDGKPVALTDLARPGPTLVFFTSVSCPFSRKAAETLVDLEIDYEEHGLKVVAVEKGKGGKKAKELFELLDLDGTVVLDADGKTCKSWGVEPIPFCFVIDKDGVVSDRGPYTAAAATGMLRETLGLAPLKSANGDSGAG